MPLLDTYRAIHTQTFLPIFGKDDHDSRRLVEACVEAGYTCIEYTLRREDARGMIPWTRRTFPDLRIIVGSTMDDERIVRQRQQHFPQLMTIAEVADLDVHGLVAMIGWRPETIARYAATHVVMSYAMTVNEAFAQISAGAHFIKFLTADIEIVRRVRSAPTFGFCPILVTGGVVPGKMPGIFESGAMLVGSGFDLILGDDLGEVPKAVVVERLRNYQQTAREARAAVHPRLAAAEDADAAAWLAVLPHYHPFTA